MSEEMHLPIYLDYMATTPMDPRVVAEMIKILDPNSQNFGNAASQTHAYGWKAQELVTQAREQVANLIGADPREIIWTSGATEANNLALKGAALFYQRKGKHIITLKTEHKAVLDSCAYLASIGFEVTLLTPQTDGLINLEQLKAAIRPDTILLSVMHVNNETGVIQDIARIASLTKEAGVLFHVDAAQSAGKITIDLKNLPVDLMSFSAHKVYGPKGMGALFVRRNPRIRLVPLIHGGGHEQGMRSGTLATHQIVGMGEAFAIAGQRLQQDQQHCRALIEQLWQGISALGEVELNGSASHRVAHCFNASFIGIQSETLLLSLPELALSSSSACNSASAAPSYVITGMGFSAERAQQAVRFSVGRFTTQEQIDYAIKQITQQVTRLRAMIP